MQLLGDINNNAVAKQGRKAKNPGKLEFSFIVIKQINKDNIQMPLMKEAYFLIILLLFHC